MHPSLKFIWPILMVAKTKWRLTSAHALTMSLCVLHNLDVGNTLTYWHKLWKEGRNLLFLGQYPLE